MEIWKQIPGFEGLYEVSNFGRIRTKEKYTNARNGHKRLLKGRILKTCVNNSGYKTVGLGRRNERKTVLVHRLVANAFVSKPDNKNEVNHIDQNKLNNFAGNLEWCTHKENVNHGDEIERGAIKQRVSIAQMDLDGNIIKIWDGFKKMDRESEYCRRCVSDCCSGKKKTYKGYIWRYAEVVHE